MSKGRHYSVVCRLRRRLREMFGLVFSRSSRSSGGEREREREDSKLEVSRGGNSGCVC